MKRVHLALLAALALAPLRARAAPGAGDKAAAQALFDDGYALMNAGKYAEACPKLEESARIDPAMGTRFRLAECNEAIGKTASAWAGYVEVADLSRAAGQAAREKVARERAGKLAPTLARLAIVVDAKDTPGLEIRRDGAPIGAAQWGEKIPVDPGAVHLTATAPGRAPWAGDATIPRAAETVTVRVPALAPAAPAPRADGGRAPREPARESGGGARRVVGIALVGAGGAAMIASGVLGLVALARYDGTGTHCRGDVCDAQGKAQTDSARALADAATWVFGAGAAVAAGGAILWLTAPRGARPPRAARVRVGPRGVFLEGSF